MPQNEKIMGWYSRLAGPEFRFESYREFMCYYQEEKASKIWHSPYKRRVDRARRSPIHRFDSIGKTGTDVIAFWNKVTKHLSNDRTLLNKKPIYTSGKSPETKY